VERRATSELRIIDAAMRVIGRKGTVRLTLAEVGTEAGYSRGLPAHLFGNKDGLLLRVVDEFINQHSQFELPGWTPGGGLKALRTTIHRWTQFGVLHPEYFRTYEILTGEALCEDLGDMSAEFRQGIREINRKLHKRLKHLLDGGKAAGEISEDVDTTYTALLITSTLRGLIAQWVIDSKAVDLVSAGDRFASELAASLKPR